MKHILFKVFKYSVIHFSLVFLYLCMHAWACKHHLNLLALPSASCCSPIASRYILKQNLLQQATHHKSYLVWKPKLFKWYTFFSLKLYHLIRTVLYSPSFYFFKLFKNYFVHWWLKVKIKNIFNHYIPNKKLYPDCHNLILL